MKAIELLLLLLDAADDGNSHLWITYQEPATTGTFFSWYDDLVVYAEAEGTATLVPRYVVSIVNGTYTII